MEVFRKKQNNNNMTFVGDKKPAIEIEKALGYL